MLQNYFTFFFPPLLYCGTEQKLCLALVGNCRRAVKHSVSFECSSQLFVMDQIRSLSWAGIQLQDRCFTVLFIGLATQRVVLHIDRRQVACREKKKNHVFAFFFWLFTDSCDIPIAAGCAKRQGWRYLCSLPAPITQTQTLMLQDLRFLHSSGMLTPWPVGKFSPFITCFLIPFSHDFLLLSKPWTRWVSLAAYFVRISLGDSLRSAVLTHVRSHSRSSVTSCHITRHLPVMACRKLSPEWQSVGCLLSLSSPMSRMLLGRE